MNTIIYNLSKYIPDKIYLQLMYYKHFHKFIDFQNPKTFNEKINWLKLHNRRPEYTQMVDKYAVREYIAEKLGEEYLIPLLGVWDDPREIDFDKLPNQFVLKWNHDSGSVVICKDKTKLNIAETIAMLVSKKSHNGYWYGREWPYKNVKPRILAEEYMEDTSTSVSAADNSTGNLTDYKFFCFDGYVDCVMVCLERSSGKTKFYFFDKDWNLKRINVRGKNAPEGFTIPKPECMDAMFDIAATLSKGLPFARIDLYQSNQHIYFGEITFFPDSGFDANLLPETDEYFGNLIDLGRIKK